MIKNVRGRGLVVVAAVVAVATLTGVGGATAATLITSKQIKDGTVLSADVKDGGLGLVDLNGAAQQAIGQAGVKTQVVSNGFGSANCPTGTVMTSGGFGTLPSDYYYSSQSGVYSITGSYPSGNGWRVTAKKIVGTYSTSSGWTYRTESYTAATYAVCAS